MSQKTTITPIHINGLDGRQMLIQNSSKNGDLLLLYGHHASIERMQSMAEFLARYYKTVTVCDLPGFGGMQSFYIIGMKPTLDNYADYLASVIRLNYKMKKLSIIGTSFSFLIVTRMLQKYPDMSKQIDLLFSLVGFTHHEDFKLKKSYVIGLQTASKVFSNRIGAMLCRYALLNKYSISLTYKLVATRHPKMKTADSKDELQRRIAADTILWQINDVRTRFYTMALMFSVNLCNQVKNIDKTVHHIYVESDAYVDQYLVEQHMRIVYADYVAHKSPMEAHMPSIVASADEAGKLFPKNILELIK